MTTVVIASFFEEEYVRRIREVDGRLRVLYREVSSRLRGGRVTTRGLRNGREPLRVMRSS